MYGNSKCLTRMTRIRLLYLYLHSPNQLPDALQKSCVKLLAADDSFSLDNRGFSTFSVLCLYLSFYSLCSEMNFVNPNLFSTATATAAFTIGYHDASVTPTSEIYTLTCRHLHTYLFLAKTNNSASPTPNDKNTSRMLSNCFHRL